MNNLCYGRPTPAMTNTERQRQFRERNPGYYGRLHAKRQAQVDALSIQMATAQVQATKPPLMLPAPIERIPGINTIPTMAELQQQRQATTVARASST